MASLGYDGKPMLPLPGEEAPGALTATATKAKLTALPVLSAPPRKEVAR
jgi:hypothetical protein